MKKKNSLIRLIPLALPLLFLLFSAGMCKKPGTCHQTITMVNHSDSVVSIAILGHYNGKVSLGRIESVAQHDTVEIPMLLRWCLEESLVSSEPATNYTLWVLPETFPLVETTFDSLEFSYDILKTIDLMQIGVDSLLKTDFTVYYP